MISATYMVCISPSLYHFSLISGRRKESGRHFLAEKDKVALLHVRDVVARGEVKTCRGEFVFVSSGMGTAVI